MFFTLNVEEMLSVVCKTKLKYTFYSNTYLKIVNPEKLLILQWSLNFSRAVYAHAESLCTCIFKADKRYVMRNLDMTKGVLYETCFTAVTAIVNIP